VEIIENLYNSFKEALPSWLGVIAVIFLAFIISLFAGRGSSALDGHKFRAQLIKLLVFVITVIIIILILPISESSQNQLLTLIGIILSAIIALSSTTFVGNAMAGLMHRSIRNFRSGDFIEAGDHFGRVSDRGLFHIEVQTIDSDLITIPNMYLVTNPVKVTRSDGTIVSADVSLGYDVQRSVIEKNLIAAAEAADLSEPFVHVIELGNFAVTYRISGLLTDVKHLISARSNLHKKMLDMLQNNGIEIVSPTFMNTRALDPNAPVLPEKATAVIHEEDDEMINDAERLLFDKAEQAGMIEKLKERFDELGQEIDSLKEQIDRAPNEVSKENFQSQREKAKKRRDRIAEILERRGQENK